MAAVTIVLPVPGGPCVSDTFAVSDSRTAAACAALRVRIWGGVMSAFGIYTRADSGATPSPASCAITERAMSTVSTSTAFSPVCIRS
eukprot:1904335-Prymnesium_polylepis.3